MSMQQKQRIKLYTPHSGQLKLHQSSARFRVMACGRRFGKTLAATNELAKNALEHNNTLNWWVAPTYRQTEIAFELLADALKPVMAKPPNKSKMRLDLINGSVLECRSAERYENMRGDGPSFVVFDEASKCPKAAWTEVIRPALADKQGRAIFISTPWGRDWFWELFQRGQNPEFPDWWSASFPTTANPFIPESEVEEARLTLPWTIFAQEFLAEFLEDAAGVFRNVDGCSGGEFKEPVYGHNYVIGWDVAKYQDYSVFTVIDCHTQEVVYIERFNGIEYKSQIKYHLIPLVHKYNQAHVIMDITGVGDPLLEEVRSQDIGSEGYYFTNTSKKALVDRAVIVLEQERIKYPKYPQLIHELKAFSYELTKSGNIIYKAPEGEHDDCVISLCLALWGAKIGAVVAYATTAKTTLTEADVSNKIPGYQQVDSAFLMKRQDDMAKSLRILGIHAPYQSVEIAGDSEWGIA